MKVYKLYKKIGETPLEALEKFRKIKKIPASKKLTYAGRLDPMAEGVLLILANASQKQKEKYLNSDKTYDVKILFGFQTDSYDLLGLPSALPAPLDENLNSKIKKHLLNYQGKINLPVPPYASVLYKGKPLFEWARAGKLTQKDLPKRAMHFKKIKFKGLQSLPAKRLLSHIQTNIKKVRGDFRQEKILQEWKKILSRQKSASKPKPGLNSKKYYLANFKVLVSSGTYIRSFAHDLGKKLKTGAVVYNLKRLTVGDYK